METAKGIPVEFFGVSFIVVQRLLGWNCQGDEQLIDKMKFVHTLAKFIENETKNIPVGNKKNMDNVNIAVAPPRDHLVRMRLSQRPGAEETLQAE